MSDNNEVKVRITTDTTTLPPALDAAAVAVERTGERMRASIESVKSMVASLAAATGFFMLAKQAVDTMASFEQLEIRLNSVMGSAASGEEAFKWIKQFAQDTPFEVDQVTKSFMLLKNFGLDPMDGTMKAISDQAAKTGGGVQTLERITIGLGQAFTKGKLQGEEAMQLLEAGVPVWDMLARILNKTTAEVQEFSEKGRLGRDVIQALVKEIGRTADGAAVAQMASLNGQFSNLSDNVKGALDEFRKDGGLDPIKEAVSDLNTKFGELKADGSLHKWSERSAEALRDIGQAARESFSAVNDAVTRIAVTFSSAVDSMDKDVNLIAVASQTVSTIFAEVSYFVQMTFEAFAGAIADVRAVVITAWEAIKLGFEQGKNTIMAAVEAIGASLNMLADIAGRVFRADFSGAQAAWDDGLKRIQEVVERRATNIRNATAEAAKNVSDAWKASGMATSGAELDRIENEYSARMKRIFEKKQDFSGLNGIKDSWMTKKIPTDPGAAPKLQDGKEKDKKEKADPSRMPEWDAGLSALKAAYMEQHDMHEMSLAEEKAYWDRLLSVTGLSEKERGQLMKKSFDVRLQMAKQQAAEAKGLALEEIDEWRRSANDHVDIAQEEASQKYALGEINKEQMLEAERTFEEARYEINRAAVEQRMELLAKDQKLKNQLLEIDRKHALEKKKIENSIQLEQNAPKMNVFKTMETSFAAAITGMLTRAQTFKQALSNVFKSIFAIFAQEMIAKPLAETAMKLVRETGLYQTFFGVKKGLLAGDVATQLTADTAGAASTVAKGAAEIPIVAGTAAAKSADSVASIPYVGPALAAAAFAATMAMVMGALGGGSSGGSSQSVPSAEGGWDIPAGATGMMKYHEREMMLPAQHADTIRKLGETGGAGGGNDVHMHVHTQSTQDFQQFLTRNSHAVAPALRRLARNFSPSK